MGPPTVEYANSLRTVLGAGVVDEHSAAHNVALLQSRHWTADSGASKSHHCRAAQAGIPPGLLLQMYSKWFLQMCMSLHMWQEGQGHC